MSRLGNTILPTLSKHGLLLLAIALIAMMSWQTIEVFYSPNLLLNGDFNLAELTRWQIIRQGQTLVRPIVSNADKSDSVLELSIAESPAGSWVGIGQRASVEPGQHYAAQLRYQPGQNSEATLVLRLSQFNRAGEAIKTDEVVPPVESPAAILDSGDKWRLFTHNFITDDETNTVEVGVGLFGSKAATVEIDTVTLKKDKTLLESVGRNPIIWILLVLLAGGLGYKWRHLLVQFVAGVGRGLKSRRRLMAIVAVNIILLFVFAELIALGLYFSRGEGLFYLHKKNYQSLGETNENRELSAKRIHPYFGYVDKPGWQRDEDNYWRSVDDELKTTNNHGLGSKYDYPFIKTHENQYIIGIFGGSVAERFALLTQNRLIENLRQDDFFVDKEIIVLNFAKGGYKQPQQLLLLTYFLSIGQKFDLVINIDGFNEVTFSHRNYQRGVDVSMPHVNIMDGLTNLIDQTTLTPEKLEVLANINRYKTNLNTLAQKINNSPLASVSFVLEQYYAFVFNNYQRELVRFDQLESGASENSLLFIKPDPQPMDDALLFGKIADTWAHASIMMSRTLAEEGAVYIHVLQPNQYYSNRTFSPAEARVALEPEAQPYYATLVRAGYPFLVEQTANLEASEVNFFNALAVFDQELAPVYIDNCCHYTHQGNEILADFIAASILKSTDFYGNNPP